MRKREVFSLRPLRTHYSDKGGHRKRSDRWKSLRKIYEHDLLRFPNELIDEILRLKGKEGTCR